MISIHEKDQLDLEMASKLCIIVFVKENKYIFHIILYETNKKYMDSIKSIF